MSLVLLRTIVSVPQKWGIYATLLRILRSAPVLFVIAFAIACSQQFFYFFYSSMGGDPYRAPLITQYLIICYALVGFMLIPLMLNTFLWQERLQDLGLQLPPNKKQAIIFTLLALIILLPCLPFLLNNPTFQHYYGNSNRLPMGKGVLMQLTAFPLYYLAEEFFFRGFFLNCLWKKINWYSYFLTEAVFAWGHLGKPPIEILFSIPVCIVLNTLTLKTKSIYPAMFTHYVIGITLYNCVIFYVK